jgi:hypothetical protein
MAYSNRAARFSRVSSYKSAIIVLGLTWRAWEIGRLEIGDWRLKAFIANPSPLVETMTPFSLNRYDIE